LGEMEEVNSDSLEILGFLTDLRAEFWNFIFAGERGEGAV